MSLRLSSAIAILGTALLPFSMFAADTTAADAGSTDSSLAISTVDVVDANTLLLTFNQSIVVDSVRVTVTNQTSRENVRVSSPNGYTPADNSDAGVVVHLDGTLTPSTAYVLTVNTAISTDNQVISAGVDAIRDFMAPATFGSDMTMPPPVIPGNGTQYNAPTNTSAVTTPPPTTTTTTVTSPTSTGTGDTSAVDNAQALPVTGVDSMLILFVVLVIAAVLIGIKKRAV